MNPSPPEQTKTAPAPHIHSQGRTSEDSAFEAQLLSVFLQVCVQIFSFRYPYSFLTNKSLKNTRVITFYTQKETKVKPKGRT